jgi:hypothetical protein
MNHSKIPFCQSCSMPMAKEEDFGINADGSRNDEFCRFCFHAGTFVDPAITLQQMIDKCASTMRNMAIPDEQIEQTKAFIPLLKRWR